jgi:hypothetical protein
MSMNLEMKHKWWITKCICIVRKCYDLKVAYQSVLKRCRLIRRVKKMELSMIKLSEDIDAEKCNNCNIDEVDHDTNKCSEDDDLEEYNSCNVDDVDGNANCGEDSDTNNVRCRCC